MIFKTDKCSIDIKKNCPEYGCRDDLAALRRYDAETSALPSGKSHALPVWNTPGPCCAGTGTIRRRFACAHYLGRNWPAHRFISLQHSTLRQTGTQIGYAPALSCRVQQHRCSASSSGWTRFRRGQSCFSADLVTMRSIWTAGRSAISAWVRRGQDRKSVV